MSTPNLGFPDAGDLPQFGNNGATLFSYLQSLVDGFSRGAVVDIVNQPSGNEPDGTTYLVSPSPSGTFLTKANQLATLQQGVWIYRNPAPLNGIKVWVNDENNFRIWNTITDTWDVGFG